MQKSKGTDQIAGAEGKKSREKQIQNKQRQRQSSYWCNRQVSYKWEPIYANSFICFSFFFVSDFPRAARCGDCNHSDCFFSIMRTSSSVCWRGENVYQISMRHWYQLSPLNSIIIKWCKLSHLWVAIKSSGMCETTPSVQRCGLSVVTRDVSHLNAII